MTFYSIFLTIYLNSVNSSTIFLYLLNNTSYSFYTCFNFFKVTFRYYFKLFIWYSFSATIDIVSNDFSRSLFWCSDSNSTFYCCNKGILCSFSCFIYAKYLLIYLWWNSISFLKICYEKSLIFPWWTSRSLFFLEDSFNPIPIYTYSLISYSSPLSSFMTAIVCWQNSYLNSLKLFL